LNSDLIISIFGISASDPEPLLKCAFNIMSKVGYLLISLRIPDNSTFRNFQLIANSYGLGIIREYSKRIRYQHKSANMIETFPILLLSNTTTNNEILKLEDLKLEN
jgi:hypothetical protein